MCDRNNWCLAESIVAFSWEPTGTKFALIHGESPNVSVSFYNVCKGSGGRVELLKKLPKRQANHLFWSPTGQFIVLAGLRRYFCCLYCLESIFS